MGTRGAIGLAGAVGVMVGAAGSMAHVGPGDLFGTPGVADADPSHPGGGASADDQQSSNHRGGDQSNHGSAVRSVARSVGSSAAGGAHSVEATAGSPRDAITSDVSTREAGSETDAPAAEETSGRHAADTPTTAQHEADHEQPTHARQAERSTEPQPTVTQTRDARSEHQVTCSTN